MTDNPETPKVSDINILAEARRLIETGIYNGFKLLLGAHQTQLTPYFNDLLAFAADSSAKALEDETQANIDDCIALLLEQGAVDEGNFVSKDNQTLLNLAAHRGQKNIVRSLLTGNSKDNQKLDYFDNSYTTPLCAAITAGHYSLAQYLVEQRANQFITNRQGQAATVLALEQLVLATSNQSTEQLDALIVTLLHHQASMCQIFSIEQLQQLVQCLQRNQVDASQCCFIGAKVRDNYGNFHDLTNYVNSHQNDFGSLRDCVNNMPNADDPNFAEAQVQLLAALSTESNQTSIVVHFPQKLQPELKKVEDKIASILTNKRTILAPELNRSKEELAEITADFLRRFRTRNSLASLTLSAGFALGLLASLSGAAMILLLAEKTLHAGIGLAIGIPSLLVGMSVFGVSYGLIIDRRVRSESGLDGLIDYWFNTRMTSAADCEDVRASQLALIEDIKALFALLDPENIPAIAEIEHDLKRARRSHQLKSCADKLTTIVERVLAQLPGDEALAQRVTELLDSAGKRRAPDHTVVNFEQNPVNSEQRQLAEHPTSTTHALVLTTATKEKHKSPKQLAEKLVQAGCPTTLQMILTEHPNIVQDEQWLQQLLTITLDQMVQHSARKPYRECVITLLRYGAIYYGQAIDPENKKTLLHIATQKDDHELLETLIFGRGFADQLTLDWGENVQSKISRWRKRYPSTASARQFLLCYDTGNKEWCLQGPNEHGDIDTLAIPSLTSTMLEGYQGASGVQFVDESRFNSIDNDDSFKHRLLCSITQVYGAAFSREYLDLDTRDARHRTPLIMAINDKNYQLATALVEAGANVFINVKGDTPLNILLNQCLTDGANAARDRLIVRLLMHHAGWHANLSVPQFGMLIDRVNAHLNGADPLAPQHCLCLQAKVTTEDGQGLTIAQALAGMTYINANDRGNFNNIIIDAIAADEHGQVLKPIDWLDIFEKTTRDSIKQAALQLVAANPSLSDDLVMAIAKFSRGVPTLKTLCLNQVIKNNDYQKITKLRENPSFNAKYIKATQPLCEDIQEFLTQFKAELVNYKSEVLPQRHEDNLEEHDHKNTYMLKIFGTLMMIALVCLGGILGFKTHSYYTALMLIPVGLMLAISQDAFGLSRRIANWVSPDASPPDCDDIITDLTDELTNLNELASEIHLLTDEQKLRLCELKEQLEVAVDLEKESVIDELIGFIDQVEKRLAQFDKLPVNADSASASSHLSITQAVVNYGNAAGGADVLEEAGPADRYHDAYAERAGLPPGGGVGPSLGEFEGADDGYASGDSAADPLLTTRLGSMN